MAVIRRKKDYKDNKEADKQKKDVKVDSKKKVEVEIGAFNPDETTVSCRKRSINTKRDDLKKIALDNKPTSSQKANKRSTATNKETKFTKNSVALGTNGNGGKTVNKKSTGKEKTSSIKTDGAGKKSFSVEKKVAKESTEDTVNDKKQHVEKSSNKESTHNKKAIVEKKSKDKNTGDNSADKLGAVEKGNDIKKSENKPYNKNKLTKPAKKTFGKEEGAKPYKRDDSKDNKIKNQRVDMKKNGVDQQKKEKTKERGQTKREMRQELENKKKLKREKRTKPKAIEAPVIVEKPKKAEKNTKKATKKTTPITKKVDKVSKTVYTLENINSFLLEAKDHKDKATNMLLFVLKNLKSNPSEVLAKVKILTSDKKVEIGNSCTQIAVLKHICEFYELKGTTSKNLFSLIASDSLLSKYLVDFIFTANFEQDEYNTIFEDIFKEICNVADKSAALPFEDFIGFYYELKSYNNIAEYKIENLEKPEPAEENEVATSINDNGEIDVAIDDTMVEKVEEDLSNNNQDIQSSEEDNENESVASTLELVSLDDDDEIERLDRQLGQMFGKGMLSIEEQKYVTGLVKCLELLIKNNIHIKIDNLVKILFLNQVECISKTVKYLVKEFLEKVSNKSEIFTIFQICALINPSIYSLYKTFYTFCNEYFDLKLFLICVFNFGHEEFVINKIDNLSFYAVYSSNLGASFDEFLIFFIEKEKSKEKLEELNELYFSDEIKAVITKTLLALDKKTKQQTTIN